MQRTISLPALIHNLEMAENETERFTNPLNLQQDVSEGFRYLYQNVLLPFLAGKRVNTTELNMNQFDLDDISILYTFYEEDFSSEYKRLIQVLSVISKTEPVHAVVAFL